MRRNTAIAFVLFCLVGIAVSMVVSGCAGNGTSNTPPVVTGATNTQGTTTLAPGATCTINGSGFGGLRSSNEYGQSYVVFVPQYPGGTLLKAATYSNWSDTQIQCIVPALTAATYQVQAVIARDPETYCSSLTPSSQNTITVSGQSSSQPGIATVTPSTVNAGGTITISGSGFGSLQGSGYVRFGLQIGGTAQPEAISWTDTEIVCTVPASVSPDSVSVYVIKGTGEESGAASIVVLSSTAPLISIISPSTIAIGSTTPITINGNNFGDTIESGSVAFQAGAGTPVTVTAVITWTAAQIIVTIPSQLAATANTVTVTVQAAAGEISNGFPVTVGASGGRVFALFVGINQYQNSSIPQLSWCVNDVTGMKGALTASTLWKDSQVVTLTDAQATKSAIQSAIGTIASQITAGDTFFFFYSGHGTNESGHSYIVPVDSDLTVASFIQDDELNEWLTAINSDSKKCFIFDSCNSGGFVGKGKDFRGRFLQIEGADPFFKGSFLSRNMSALPNMVFLAASTGGQLSVESDSLQHGAFSNYIIEGLGSGTTIGPAATGGTSITAQQAFTYAAPLTTTFNSGQTPQVQDNFTAGLPIKQ